MFPYTIKPMESEDERLGKAYVHYHCWHETYTGLLDADYLRRTSLEQCIAIAHRYPDNLLVAKDGERVVGFAGFGRCRDEGRTDCGEIFALYVLPTYQGRRIGYELMNAAIAQIPDCRTIFLWVLKGNDKAIRFYEQYGFVCTGEEKELHPSTPNTELRMIYARNET